MLKYIPYPLARLLPRRIPQLDRSDTALPHLNGIYDRLMKKGGRELRPTYTWAMVQSIFLADVLGIRRISAIELGVAGGNGLLALERAADELEKHFRVRVDVYGFDSGEGLPEPRDYRDLPNLWPAGGYEMDLSRLRERLSRAELVIGDVAETVPRFLDSAPAAIAFMSFDLDFYSSTIEAMQLLRARHEQLMPRIHCYFDDILGYSCGHHNGERLAISEFNDAHPSRQISQIYGLRFYLPRRYRDAIWTEKMFMTHIIDHPLYNEWDGMLRRAQMPLAA